MSDTGSERPLTRRERRLLEMQQEADHAGSPSVEESAEPTDWDPIDEDTILPDGGESTSDTDAEDDLDIEIDESLIELPSVDAQGNPLSRRELRKLRQEAIEELRAQKRAELEAEAASSTPPATSEEIPSYALPTEALSLEELQTIESDSAPDASEVPSDDDIDVLEQLIEGSAEEAPVEDPLPRDDTDAEEPDDGPTEASAEDPRDAAESAAEVPASVSPAEPDEEGYTFPDIKPLDVERPVFDDPSVRTVGTPGSAGQGPGFDDMIQRAVADENASVHTGNSSLILPSIPGSDGLSGPIGSTGELFVTGSFELPKSIGETGGHAHLQDSVEGDEEQEPVDMVGLTDVYDTSEFDSAPVSASRAVSTRSLNNSGITTPEVQRENKKSMILIGTGGGLILLLVGAGIWAVQSGLFG